MISVVHITPRFAPQIDGLGDYARLLAAELKHDHGWENRFIIGDPQWATLVDRAGATFHAGAVSEQTPEALQEILADSSIVVLHYVPYGYHVRGVPFWINRALQRWKAASPGRRLIVVFHELWASGPPWKSEFYLGWIQRRLVHELQHLADGSITSTPIMFKMLNAISPNKTAFAPIPSCVTPPPANWTIKSGKAVTVIVFGLEASRLLSVQAHSKLIQALFNAGLLAELRVIGKGASGPPAPSEDVRALQRLLPSDKIVVFRDLDAVELAGKLSDGDLFLSYYPSAFLCKSSALTAAMACGCVPVLPELKNASPAVAGREILGCDGSAVAIHGVIDLIEGGQLPELREHARAWYEANASWAITTRAVARLLGSP